MTESENKMLEEAPNKEEVKNTLWESNLRAAPGTDGIPSLLYSKCWGVMGTALTQVAQAICGGGQPTYSMRTSLMVFGSKPKKPNSIKPGDIKELSGMSQATDTTRLIMDTIHILF